MVARPYDHRTALHDWLGDHIVSTRRTTVVRWCTTGRIIVAWSYECSHVVARSRATFAQVARLRCDLSVALRLRAAATYMTATCSLQWIVQITTVACDYRRSKNRAFLCDKSPLIVCCSCIYMLSAYDKPCWRKMLISENVLYIYYISPDKWDPKFICYIADKIIIIVLKTIH